MTMAKHYDFDIINYCRLRAGFVGDHYSTGSIQAAHPPPHVRTTLAVSVQFQRKLISFKAVQRYLPGFLDILLY
jgi:glycerol uptake facilitator-like aquaporin